MVDLRTQLADIITARSARVEKIDRELAVWRVRRQRVLDVLETLKRAEEVNPELLGKAVGLDKVLADIGKIIGDYERERSRFSRKSLCIGIGGAARGGKSTFLQSITGLNETQIPTSDKYFTTAIRSQIENNSENIAVADFHSEETFLRHVIAPLCTELRLPVPFSLDEFSKLALNVSGDVQNRQGYDDMFKRLQDAQRELPSYRKYLTGERGYRIQLSELRPYVAYPEGGLSKAGPFLAISNLVIQVPFPSTDVAQLRVIDLPGLGEAGVNLAKVQTAGLENICDVTLLMKRPTDTNIEWTSTDSSALDAMSDSVPLLKDQTKYTIILANVGQTSEDRAEACIRSIKGNLHRPFLVLECNAKDKSAVIGETMPRILEFLATNLPEIDNAIVEALSKNSRASLHAIESDVHQLQESVRAVAPTGVGGYDFYRTIFNQVSQVLYQQTKEMQKKAQSNDSEWEQEVGRIHGEVKNWIANGCGYESKERLLEAITKEIRNHRAQPTEVINACRTKFRAEWEKMDSHLDKRIADMLIATMDALGDVLHSFVPQRDSTLAPLLAVKKQISEFADRIDERHSDPGDAEALRELSAPLRRIAEFDLQFRFHLEPMLHAATRLLLSNELPLVQDECDAPKLLEKLQEKLYKAAEDYAVGMQKTASGSNLAFEKKKRLLETAIPNVSLRNDLIATLEKAAGTAQSFCPSRIFASVLETFEDAFIRSKDSEKAFSIIAKEWRNELMPTFDEKTRLTNEAAGAVASLTL